MKKFYFSRILLALLFVSMDSYGQNKEITAVLDKARSFVNKKNADSALVYADKALQMAIRKNDMPSHIRALGVKGKAFFYQNKSNEAASYYFEALKLCKSPGDDNQIAYLYGEVGYVYFSQGHYKEAKDYYYKALAIRKQLHQDKEVCNALINITGMCRDNKEYDESIAALDEVRGMLPEVKDTAIEGYYYTNRGVLLELTGHADSAAYYYHKAYDVWKLLHNEAQIFKITFNIGYLAEERKDHREALRYYHLAEESAKKFGTGKEIAHVYGTIAEAYAGLNDFKSGYKYLHDYAELSDSLNRDEFNSYVIKLDKQFQTEKSHEIIQEQELKLKTANLAVQEQRSTKLLIILILIVVLFVAVAIFSYLTFQNRLHKKVEEAKGRFFANVVHEIRTPLSMIQGPIKVLQGKTTDESMHYQLDIAERNTRRLNDLIDQMLDISKLDASAYRLNESIGSLSDFTEELIRQFDVQAKEKQLSFSKQIEIVPGYLSFDKDAVEKIINNLLCNAIKYTPRGGSVGIEVNTSKKENDIDVRLVVWDTGPGIAKEEQTRIFDRFYRSGEQHKAGTKGIGIGLALVKELVTLMNGSVNVTSEPGKGSVFTVNLPLKQKEQTVTVAGNAIDPENTILLVEDDTDILNFNKTLLTEKGYNVITATDGNEASGILKDKLPDLVITDLMMPGKDGLTVLKEIRANTLTEHIPVIILSAKASAQSKIEGVTEGAQVYLPKPFQPEELVAIVRNQLQIIQKQKALYQQQTTEETKSIEERFSGNDPFTRKCFLLIQEHLDDAQLSVEKLAELMNINRSHFQRKIKTLTGYSPSELIRDIRLETAWEMLLKKEGNITEIAYATGFTSQSYFTKCFSEHFGFPPSQLPAL